MTAPEHPPVGVGLRWVRAFLVAALAWGTASAGHVMAGGEPPSAWLVAVLVAVTAWPFSMVLRTRAGSLRMVALLGAGQAVMHSALVMASWQVVSAPAVNQHGMAEMPPSRPMMGPGHEMSLLPGPSMVLAHVVAALVLGVVLADADRSLFALLTLLLAPVQVFGRHRVLHVLALLLVGASRMRDAGKPSRGDVAVAIRRLRQRLLVAAIGRRGPPVVLA